MLVHLAVRVLGRQAETYPLVAIAAEQLDVLGRQRRGKGTGVHLGLQGFAQLGQGDVLVPAVDRRFGGHYWQRQQ
ncbi:hypothetical protein D3C76_1177280 [compost metagenome]